jgi:hypothetical protein
VRVLGLVAASALLTLGCVSDNTMAPTPKSEVVANEKEPALDPSAPLDKVRAESTFVTTTDLMRYVVAPSCAAENNECHNNEDFPDLSTEGNLWNLVGLACNQGIGERTEVEDFCEAEGDELVLGSFASRIGAVVTVTDDDGEFLHYAVTLETPLSSAVIGGDFVVRRAGSLKPELGSGSSAEGDAGSYELRVVDPAEIPDPGLVRQGDENENGHFGDGSGALVQPGDAHASYLMRRLLDAETERVSMPLNSNADNPTEINRALSEDAAYAMMSWINCVEPSDGPYSAIRYGCPANNGNEGSW